MPVLEKELHEIQVTLEYRFTLKRVRDMIITFSSDLVPMLSNVIRLQFLQSL